MNVAFQGELGAFSQQAIHQLLGPRAQPVPRQRFDEVFAALAAAEVDAAVRRTIDNGNMSTLNCPEEVYLAERLIELHPWADMVRFARAGGEVNAITIRIARAASG